MRIDVEHRMHFRYDDFVRESQMELRVEPRSSAHQTVHSFQLAVGPPASVERYVDWNENIVHSLGIRDYHDRIEIVTRSLVEVEPAHPALASLAEPPEAPGGALLEFGFLGGPVDDSAATRALAAELRLSAQVALGEQLAELGALVRERLEYQPGVTTWRSSAGEAMEKGGGVCQDFAHLSLALLRLRGLAARYVSGYLHLEESDEPAQSHAWVEVYAGARGWVAYDPTHERVPDERYVHVASGRHYDDVPPTRGVYRGRATEEMVAEVHTALGGAPDVVSLRERSLDLDVPVYTELPAPGRRQRPGAEEQPPEPREQQQQQQQQGRRDYSVAAVTSSWSSSGVSRPR